MSHDDRLREIADRVLWLEDGQSRRLAAVGVDPVRRTQVEPHGTRARWRGEQW